MLLSDAVRSKQEFKQLLDSLRKKISELPGAERTTLQQLVEDSDRAFSTLFDNCAALNQAVADLTLATTWARFEMECSQRELRQLLVSASKALESAKQCLN